MNKIKTVLISGTISGCEYAEVLKKSVYSRLVLAVTGPDRRVGRGRKKKKPELARYCGSGGTEVFQTEEINSPDSIKKLKASSAEAALVVDFGQILSPRVLNIFPKGCFNIHYSLLPDLRGAAPVRHTLMRGYEKTGVTLIKMNKEIDAGEIVDSRKVNIPPTCNYKKLKEMLNHEGKILVNDLMKALNKGEKLNLHPQDISEVTTAPKIDKKKCRINWDSPASLIVNKVRALSPNPACWSMLDKNGQRIKILEALILPGYEKMSALPGEVLVSSKKKLAVQARRGAVDIIRLQPAGKRVMDISSFLAGHDINPGDRFT